MCGANRDRTEAVPAIGKSPQLCDSAPQSGRSKYYSPNMEFALIHRHCEHTKERQERGEEKETREKGEKEKELGGRGWAEERCVATWKERNAC